MSAWSDTARTHVAACLREFFDRALKTAIFQDQWQDVIMVVVVAVAAIIKC
jgi:hypothetical protein